MVPKVEGVDCNHVHLRGRLIDKESLRYTPSGAPVIKATLEHHSSVIESGVCRQVELICPLVAIGEAAQWLHAAPMGAPAEVKGFLAAKRKSSPSMVVHVQTLILLEES